jgi:hypothetical protein
MPSVWREEPCPLGWDLRPSRTVLSMWLQTVKFITKGSKCVSLAQEIGFSTPNSSTLPWLVQRDRVVHLQKECDKLEPPRLSISNWSILIIGPGGLLLLVPHVRAVLVSVLFVGLPQNKTAKHRHLILLSRVPYWAPLEMLLLSK